MVHQQQQQQQQCSSCLKHQNQSSKKKSDSSVLLVTSSAKRLVLDTNNKTNDNKNNTIRSSFVRSSTTTTKNHNTSSILRTLLLLQTTSNDNNKDNNHHRFASINLTLDDEEDNKQLIGSMSSESTYGLLDIINSRSSTSSSLRVNSQSNNKVCLQDETETDEGTYETIAHDTAFCSDIENRKKNEEEEEEERQDCNDNHSERSLSSSISGIVANARSNNNQGSINYHAGSDMNSIKSDHVSTMTTATTTNDADMISNNKKFTTLFDLNDFLCWK